MSRHAPRTRPSPPTVTRVTPNNKKIDGYPSIWMVKGSDVIEYDAKPNAKSLTEYIKAAVF